MKDAFKVDKGRWVELLVRKMLDMSASPKIAWGDSRTLKDRHVGNHIEKKWMEFRKSCRETSIAVKDNADAEDECFSKVINREVDTDWKNA